MKEIIKETLNILESGQSVVWATIIEHAGSTPRKAASRMLVKESGRTLGSVGGGILEAEALETAADLFKFPGSRVIDVSMTGQEVAETDMICGGSARMFVELLAPGAFSMVRRLYGRVDAKGEIYFLTCIGDNRSFEASHFILEQGDGELDTSMLPSAIVSPVKSHIAKGEAPVLFPHPEDGGMLFLEQLERTSTLYILGGGHVSLELAWLAHRVGFEVIVVDDREAFANRDRFPMASRVEARPYLDALKGITFGLDDFVAIVTRGHLHDLEVLREVIGKTPDYIGMIGSRRKKAVIFDTLEKEGVSRNRLNEVYTPVGLSIGAQTPAEIAVSIVAEMIQVRTEIKTKRSISRGRRSER